jgi:hypothetical protein
MNLRKVASLSSTTRRYIPDERTLYNHWRENLKSYIMINVFSLTLFQQALKKEKLSYLCFSSLSDNFSTIAIRLNSQPNSCIRVCFASSELVKKCLSQTCAWKRSKHNNGFTALRWNREALSAIVTAMKLQIQRYCAHMLTAGIGQTCRPHI